MTIAERKAKLEKTLSGVAGCSIELTIRGQREFTVSYDGIDAVTESRVTTYFASHANCRVERIDDDTDTFTAIFVDVNA